MVPRSFLAILGASFAVAACGAVLWWASQALPIGPGQQPASARPARIERDHKPLGPIEVELRPALTAGTVGAAAAFSARVQPIIDLASVSWTWELSPGVTLLQGAASGTGDPHRGALTTWDVLLQPPAGEQAAWATLIVTANFAGADEAGPVGIETVQQQATLRWGTPPKAPVPTEFSFDAETGAPAEFAVLPAAHRPGR